MDNPPISLSTFFRSLFLSFVLSRTNIDPCTRGEPVRANVIRVWHHYQYIHLEAPYAQKEMRRCLTHVNTKETVFLSCAENRRCHYIIWYEIHRETLCIQIRLRWVTFNTYLLDYSCPLQHIVASLLTRVEVVYHTLW